MEKLKLNDSRFLIVIVLALFVLIFVIKYILIAIIAGIAVYLVYKNMPEKEKKVQKIKTKGGETHGTH